MKISVSRFNQLPRFGRLLLSLASLCSSLTARAETNFTVIAMTNVWRYNETTNVDGAGWQQPGYDDSAWVAGPGMFGFEDNVAIAPLIGTALKGPTAYTPPAHAVYFRTRFSMPETRPVATLFLTNRIDDGAVFYLNGAPLTRVRMPSGIVTSTTLADDYPTSSDAVQDESLSLNVSNLVVGENVLAVSVHSYWSGDNDTVFGCAAAVLLPDPVVITGEPQSLTVESNQPAMFSVSATGSLLRYQWKFKGATIPNATGARLDIASANGANAGAYLVVVSNAANSVTSQVATLTVTADRTPPALVSAEASETGNQIFVRFSENILRRTVTNINNYLITEIGSTNQLAVTNAISTGNLLQLKVTPMWTSGNAYVLSVNNVSDMATNAIAPDSRIGIGMWQTLLETNALWNWSEGFDLTGQDWTSPAYDESTNSVGQGGQWRIPDPAWNGVGRSTFYFYCFANPPSTVPSNTVLSIGFPTYYFRTRFVIPPGSTTSSMTLSGFVDDGAVFYLNGKEIYRNNMPAGIPGYRTLALAQKSPFGSDTLAPFSTSISVTNLVGGANLLAVELHPYSSDPNGSYEKGICLGAWLRGTVAPDTSVTAPAPSGSLSAVTPARSQPQIASRPPEPNPSTASPAAPEGISNVIQISIDGGGAYWIQQYVSNSPGVFSNFYRLQTEGAFTYNARCDADHSYTIPNHTCMLAGRPVFQPTNMSAIQHGYSNTIGSISDDGSTIHNYANTNVPYKASAFDVVHDHGLGTEFLLGKATVGVCERSYNAKYGAPDLIPPDNGSDKIDYSIVADSYAEQLVTLFLQNLRFVPPKRFTFLHFVDPDKAGHFSTGGTGWGTPSWSNSIVDMDRQIGRILDAAQHDPALSNRIAIIVTADHGGDGDGEYNHGFPKRPTTFTIPVLLWGPGIPAGVDLYSLFSNRADPGTNWLDYSASPQPIRNGDTGNLALNLLGLPPIPGSLMIPKFAWDEPSLALQTTNAALVVSWSGYATNFQLEASALIDAVATWAPVTENITQADGRFTHAVNASPGENRFYRLRKVTP